jgi:outer membrane protein TolC
MHIGDTRSVFDYIRANMSKKVFWAIALFAAAAAGLRAQDIAQVPPKSADASLSVITLKDAIDSAATSGDDFLIAAGTLEVANKQRALDLAKQGLSLSASGSYGVVDGLGKDTETTASTDKTVIAETSALQSYDQSLISKAANASNGSTLSSSYNGIASTPAASLSLSGPLTKATLSAAQTIPVPEASIPTVTQQSVVGLNLAQTVWDGYPGGQYKATLTKSLLAFQGKELAATQSGSAAVTKVKQAYIAMLAAQRDLDIKKQVLAKQQNMLAQIEAIYAIKQASAIDLRTAQVNARSAELDVSTSDKTLRLANERLAVIMGRDRGERFSVADIEDPEMPAASVDEAISTGLRKRSDVAQLDLNAKSSLIDAAVTRAQAKPNVSLSGGAGLAIGWMSPPVVAGALSVGAKVALPIFDSGAADFQAKTSESQAALYGLQAAQLRKTISSDIRDYFESAQLQAEKVMLAKESADLAEAQFELMKAQNKYGTATMQDVLTASVTAATAEVSYGTAKSAYLSAVLQLSTAMGL